MKYFLGFLNTILSSVLTWLLLLVLYLFGQIDEVESTRKLMFIVYLKKGGWFFSRFFAERGFRGCSLGNCIFVSDEITLARNATIRHEEAHCIQRYIFGVLFILVYFLMSAFIYICLNSKHYYYDNLFERNARRAAGQLVDIPESKQKVKNRHLFS